MEHPSEHESKIKFAYYLYKLGNGLDAMRQLSEDYNWNDANFILSTYKRWQFDEVVEEELQRLKNVPPSKNEISLRLAELIKDKRTDPADVAKCADVLGKLEGWIKPSNSAAEGKRNGTDKLEELAAMILDEVEETPKEVIVEVNNGII